MIIGTINRKFNRKIGWEEWYAQLKFHIESNLIGFCVKLGDSRTVGTAQNLHEKFPMKSRFTHILNYCGWKKSCTTLDGWTPINNGTNHLSTGAGFLPSTVGIFPTIFDLASDRKLNRPQLTKLHWHIDEYDSVRTDSWQVETCPTAWIFDLHR